MFTAFALLILVCIVGALSLQSVLCWWAKEDPPPRRQAVTALVFGLALLALAVVADLARYGFWDAD